MTNEHTPPRRRTTIERSYPASLQEVWDLWTTKDGFASWWGPEGFTVEVRELDLRPGGDLVYVMTATAPPQVEFMKKAGMPLSTEARITYLTVTPCRRLEYQNRIDFVPGVTPYATTTTVELHPTATGVRMHITLDAMHDEEWTKRAVMGWESQLGKLGTLIELRAKSR